MEKYFSKRIHQRRALAYFLLVIAIIILLGSLISFMVGLGNQRNESYDKLITPFKDSVDGMLTRYKREMKEAAKSLSPGLDSIAQKQVDALTAKLEQFPATQQSIGDSKLTKLDLLGTIGRITILIIAFFVAQIFIKLYRYNILIADYYAAREDALALCTQLRPAEIRDFEKLVKALDQQHITLETPKEPDWSPFAKLGTK